MREGGTAIVVTHGCPSTHMVKSLCPQPGGLTLPEYPQIKVKSRLAREYAFECSLFSQPFFLVITITLHSTQLSRRVTTAGLRCNTRQPLPSPNMAKQANGIYLRALACFQTNMTRSSRKCARTRRTKLHGTDVAMAPLMKFCGTADINVVLILFF